MAYTVIYPSTFVHPIGPLILLRLPLKSLCRCLLVSTVLRDVIRHPDFASRYLDHAGFRDAMYAVCPAAGSTLYGIQMENVVSSILNPNVMIDAIQINVQLDENLLLCGSVDGLVLVESPLDVLSLINPYTSEVKHVPNPPPQFLDSEDGNGYGLGKTSNDFKIVGISKFEQGIRLCTYSLRNNKWGDVLFFDFNLLIQPGIFTGGSIQWIAFVVAPGAERDNIAAFNLETEKFEIIELPDHGLGWNFRLGVVDGKIFVLPMDQSTFYWVREEDGIWERYDTAQPIPLMQPCFRMPIDKREMIAKIWDEVFFLDSVSRIAIQSDVGAAVPFLRTHISPNMFDNEQVPLGP